MSKLTKATEMYWDEGANELIIQGSRYIQRRIRRYMRGGLSSRPRIRPVAGSLHPLINQYFNYKYGTGVDIMQEDWDTLLLLDACRYDDFAERNQLPGTIDSRISRGPDSRRFILSNFTDRTLHDTVYVTANPHVRLVDDSTFHAVIDDPISEWDRDIKCVRPEVVSEAASRAHDRFPDKRIIVHYMQPHDPPLGPTAKSLRKELTLGGPMSEENETDGKRLLPAVVDGQIKLETARQAYRETLDIVLQNVESLLSEIEGKIIISADHGEMFGEAPYPILGSLYEHYDHPKTVELCKVPWFIIDNDGDRRIIEEEFPTSQVDVNEEEIEEQLSALGYK